MLVTLENACSRKNRYRCYHFDITSEGYRYDRYKGKFNKFSNGTVPVPVLQQWFFDCQKRYNRKTTINANSHNCQNWKNFNSKYGTCMRKSLTTILSKITVISSEFRYIFLNQTFLKILHVFRNKRPAGATRKSCL